MAIDEWEIKIEEGIEERWRCTIPVNIISEKGVKNVMNHLMFKYTLSCEEIVEYNCKRNTRKHKIYFEIARQVTFTGDIVITSLSTECAGYNIYAVLRRKKLKC